MLVPTYAPDIVPGVGLVAEVALIDSRVVLTGDHHRHHMEVMHVVARRRLVALCTVSGRRRRMLEACHTPTRGPVACRTLLPEQVAMRAAIAVAREAIETIGRFRSPVESRGADGDEGIVIHPGRPHPALVLNMACRTRLHRRVKRRRLPRQGHGVRGVAQHASGGFDPAERRMAGFTVLREEGVPDRQRAGPDRFGPKRQGLRARTRQRGGNQHHDRQRGAADNEISEDPPPHGSHRSP